MDLNSYLHYLFWEHPPLVYYGLNILPTLVADTVINYNLLTHSLPTLWKTNYSCSFTANMRKLRGAPLFYDAPDIITTCGDILRVLQRDISYPSSYKKHWTALNRNLAKYLRTAPEHLEGNSGWFDDQRLMYYWIANSSSIRTVCETGFNAGHSTLQWLTANEKIQVYLIRPWYAYIFSTYGRLSSIHISKPTPHVLGDSRKTLRKIKKEKPDLKCDLVVIDGGHTYHVAYSDMLHMENIVNPNGHLIILDDLPGIRNVDLAWEQTRAEGRVIELFRCCLDNVVDIFHGFTLGQYVRKPLK